MQTFLPSSSFKESARVLDRNRLNKQRLETLQILNVLLGKNPEAGWRNHPAVLMWKGYEMALVAYGIAICGEWIRRGYEDTCMAKICKFAKGRAPDATPDNPKGWTAPPWLGDERLHSNHRARLLSKMPKNYARYGWTELPVESNWWPVTLEHDYTPQGEMPCNTSTSSNSSTDAIPTSVQ